MPTQTPKGHQLSKHAQDKLANEAKGVDVDSVIDYPSFTYTQIHDNAKVYVKKTSRKIYDIVVYGHDEIITVIRVSGADARHQLRNLARNHRWY